MENRLKQLFDSNIILSHPRLDAMIADTLSHYRNFRVELSDDEAVEVAAAGISSTGYTENKQRMPWRTEE